MGGGILPNMKRFISLLWLLLSITGYGFAQYRPVDPLNTYQRVIAIVPIVGEGTKLSPKKPLLADLPGIVAWKAELSDDKRFALIELVAKDRRLLEVAFTLPAFAQARAQTPQLKIEHKDQGRSGAVLEEFSRMKRGFRPERFGVAVP